MTRSPEWRVHPDDIRWVDERTLELTTECGKVFRVEGARFVAARDESVPLPPGVRITPITEWSDDGE